VPNTICPFAAQHILHGEEDKRPIITPIASALHIAVTTASGDALARYFDSETVKDDSTFYVDLVGGLWQFGPVNRKANAQFGGNSICVSVETAGMSGPLNDAQLKTLIRLYAWLWTEWHISLEVSTSWNGPGAGWHSKYPEWNKNNHQCPGQPRVDQLKTVILPGAKALVAGTPPQEDDMQFPAFVPCPWMPSNPGQEPYWVIHKQEPPKAGESHKVAVVSFHGAPFTPAFSPGQHGDFEDFVFLGLYWRKWNTTGDPNGFLVYPDRVCFTAQDTDGTYTIAHK
jgi:hypothetical protein